MLDSQIGYDAHGYGELDPDRYIRSRHLCAFGGECARCGEPVYDGELCEDCLGELYGGTDDE